MFMFKGKGKSTDKVVSVLN